MVRPSTAGRNLLVVASLVLLAEGVLDQARPLVRRHPVASVLGAARLLRSEASGQQRARLLNTASGLTLVGLGLYVAASKRGA